MAQKPSQDTSAPLFEASSQSHVTAPRWTACALVVLRAMRVASLWASLLERVRELADDAARPPARRRADGLTAPGYHGGSRRADATRTRTALQEAHTQEWRHGTLRRRRLRLDHGRLLALSRRGVAGSSAWSATSARAGGRSCGSTASRPHSTSCSGQPA